MKLSTKLSGKFYSRACCRGILSIRYVLPLLSTNWTLCLTSIFAKGMYVCMYVYFSLRWQFVYQQFLTSMFFWHVINTVTLTANVYDGEN
jgi:hypothetical protein